MNVSKRGWKRCMAILLSLVICICFMPADAFAFIGPVVGVAEDMQIKTDITKDGWHIAQLKNDYITFEIETGQGLICRTVPTKTAGDISLKKSYDQNIFQELDFGEYDYGGTYAWTEDGRPEIIEETKQLVPDKVKVISGDGLILEYSFQNTHVKCRATFRLVEMTEGMYRGRYNAPVSVDNYYNEHGTQERGRTYVVTVEFKFYSIKQLYYDSYGTSNNYVHLKSHRLPYYGHENETNPKRILAEYGRFSAHEYLLPAGRTKFIGWEHTPQVCGLTDVTGGCTDIWTGTDKTPDWDGTGYNPKTESVDNYTNVGTLTYDEANPFVLLGDNFGHIEGDAMVNSSNEAYGIEGSLPAGAVSMTYIPPSGDGPSRDKDLLLTKSNAVFIYLNHGDMQNTYWEEDRYFAITSLVWGYRNLYKEGQTVVSMGEEAKALDSEFEAMGLNPDQLVITKSGDSYKAELNPTEEIKDAVAILSGSINYVKDGGYYAFNNGKAYLSPTVTANFDPAKDYFRVKPDGTIEYRGIRISVPTYCLYKSKNRTKGKEPEFSYDSEKGLVIGLDPTNNEAIINVNIPYATTSIDGVSLDLDGNVNFYGGVHIA
ncbi:MAG: hypothetical protein J6Q41_07565, partial [Firmicutes bacterium]|nr:hypothetical protein [Bacillota bacterium]